MRRWGLWFAILAALTGTPLRHLEAAGDLSRAISAAGVAEDVGTPDGGVGDQPEEGTFAVAQAPPVAHDLVADVVPLPPPIPMIAPSAEDGRWVRVWWPQNPPRQRFAWLQCFRF